MSLLLSWHRVKRWLKFWQAGQKALLVAVILLLGAIVYAVIALWPEGDIERKASGSAQIRDVDSYDRVMKDGSLAESIQFIKTFEDKRDDPVTVRIKNLEDKLALADRIVELSNDELSENVGLLKRLEATFELQRLFNLNGLSASPTSQQLKSQAEELSGSDDENVSRLAQLALIYSKAFDIGETVDPTTDTAVGEFQSSMTSIAERFPDDSFAVLQLVEYASELEQAGRVQGTYEYLVALSEAYRGNENKTIADIIAKVDIQKRRKKFNLAGGSGSVENLRQKVLNENSRKAKELISAIKDDPTPAGEYLELLNCAMLITQAGYPETASDLLDQSRNLFEYEAVPAGRKQLFSNIDKIVGQVGSKLAIGDSVAEQLREQPTLLLLVPSTKVDRFQNNLKNIGEMTRLMISKSNLDVIAVFMEEETPGRTLAEFSDRLAGYPGIRLFSLSIEDAKSFLIDYPITWVPTWVLLDDQQQIRQIGPPLPILEEMLLEVVDDNSP